MKISAADAKDLFTMIRRHQSTNKFCACCGQPWPCDVRRLEKVVTRVLLEVE